MVKGERPRFCQNCYRVEDAGGTSIRQMYVRDFGKELSEFVKSTDSEGAAPVSISTLDMSLSNNCNLKCRMCNPLASGALTSDFDACSLPYDREGAGRATTGWKDEDRLLGILTEGLERIENVLTTGGEPFLSKLHLRFVEAAVESGQSKNMTLRYHTNLTLFPARLVELWQEFKQIEVHTSIEGFGELNEYIRHPSKWSVTVKTFESLIELRKRKNFWLEVHTCFQAYNVLRLTELLEFLKTYREDIPMIPYFIGLNNPSHLAANVLPTTLQNAAREKALRYIEDNQSLIDSSPYRDFNLEKIEILKGHLRELAGQDSQGWNEFTKYTKTLDAFRKQKITDHLGELSAFWSPTS